MSDRMKSKRHPRTGLRIWLLPAAALVVILVGNQNADAAVWYVDIDNTSGTEDGTSWATAFKTIQEGVDAAVAAGASESAPAEVWVAEGTYTGVGRVVTIGGASTENVLELEQYVHLWGGFQGNETLRSQRNWEESLTIINGENVRRCIVAQDIGVDPVTLDGFYVRDGAATTTSGDWATRSGGGMYIFNSSLQISKCVFSGNTATKHGGGVVYLSSLPCLPTCSFADCTFTNNSVGECGGGNCGTCSETYANQPLHLFE